MIFLSEATVTPPLNAQAGDTLERTGSTLKLIRNGQMVATGILGQPEPIETGEVLSNRTITSLFVAREVHMPLSVTVESVVYAAPPSTMMYVNFTDGSQLEFSSRAALLDHAADLETDSDWAKNALIRAWLHRSPQGDNPAWINGKTMQFDLSLDIGPLVIGAVQ